MVPSAQVHDAASSADATIASLRKTLCSETTPLPLRFRALFSLKHLARESTKDGGAPSALAAIDAIAAGFASPSALLKHELAYCLGQTGNDAAGPYLHKVLGDMREDPMCRHEAAEALGALGNAKDLEILREFRDREGEEVVVKETCEIAIDRIEWENSEQKKQDKLRHRFVRRAVFSLGQWAILIFICLVTSSPSTQPHRCPSRTRPSRSWRGR